ncbi:hypothetical protein GJU93_02560 [Brucella sp. 10RB9212]|uniref:hypothetical protein n=1 Tax=unclassified Brucella TaxID=2632610 RepID=UPI000972A9B8|nr:MULTISPECIES: hypothetical protein [unclassified Brucella]APY14329.1 hypothetical protein BKD02_08680 [Brucella sp. 09RB8910]MRN45486.1 hypothetical protein [Brucella sp. 10RB9212]
MKISLTKDIEKIRASARNRVDELFAARIDEAIGPKASLYSMKYAAALALLSGVVSPLISSMQEAEAIIAKNAEMQAALAIIESDRQALQAEIDEASTAHEIERLISQ